MLKIISQEKKKEKEYLTSRLCNMQILKILLMEIVIF